MGARKRSHLSFTDPSSGGSGEAPRPRSIATAITLDADAMAEDILSRLLGKRANRYRHHETCPIDFTDESPAGTNIALQRK